jgi:hypothetical protein
MRKIKSYEEFLNEENIIRNIALGSALTGSLMGSPTTAVGQDTDQKDPQEITGRYGVDDIETVSGILVKDTRDFEELIHRIKEVTENVQKDWDIISVEDLGEWNSFRVKLSEKNLSPGTKSEQEVYIPKEDFDKFSEQGIVTEWIINSFITLEDNPVYINRNKNRIQNPDNKTYRL